MPDLTCILRLEDQIRHGGTGLQKKQLLGCWRLKMVARRASSDFDTLSSNLLRILGARLELRSGSAEPGLVITNSVRVGDLVLRFIGVGELQGTRPLLRFGFDRVQLWLGQSRLMERSLPHPALRKGPFFALIGSDQEEHPATGQMDTWLVARGRSGGIAVWYRMEETPTLGTHD